MKALLHELCTTDAASRRQALAAHLAALFPDRLRVETRSWEAGAAARETVNHLVTFGKEGGHLVIGEIGRAHV